MVVPSDTCIHGFLLHIHQEKHLATSTNCRHSLCHMLEKAAAAMVLRWGIVGCGDVTEVKSGPAFQAAENSRLVAVMRRDGQKAKDYAERHKVPKWYNTLDGILNDPEALQSCIGISTIRFSSRYDSNTFPHLESVGFD